MPQQTIPRSKTPEYRRKYEYYVEAHGYRATVDGTVTRRKLEALQAIGYPLSHIGARMGRSQQSLSKTVHRATLVHQCTAKAIDRLYDELHDTRPEGDIAHRTRLRAMRLGYAPPAAWDSISDLSERPKGVLKA